MRSWQITGLIAALVIVLSVPLYVYRRSSMEPLTTSQNNQKEATFVGRERCASCHEPETERWRGSDHDKAMAEASVESVLGDFDNALFEHQGIISRFFRKEGGYYVHTMGADGRMQDFEVNYTFGHDPLQQYLVAFDDGRLQALSIAWDTRQKRWYHLNGEEKIQPSDWLHWTQQSHNWNGMCADCHSTHLQKKFDAKTDRYQTSWFEINVSCEACHGPGSEHAQWADLPELARPEIDNVGLVVKTNNLNAEEQIAICARCHSRRVQLSDFDHSAKETLDYMIPELLTESLYHADGQILDEVYVYGSFIQSKMYQQDVSCSDCHDVHSGKRHFEDNRLCLQCHRGEVYDNQTHHFHKAKGEAGDPIRDKSGKMISAVGEGSLCINCHMPGQPYMGVDIRSDHSLRVPRPDLSISLGSPNACNQCHTDRDNKWALENFTRWYGLSRKPHYGSILAAGRQHQPEAEKDLLRLSDDQLAPAIVRASALQLLTSYNSEQSRQAFDRALVNEDPLIRYNAVRYYNRQEPQARKKALHSMLADPVKVVRMESAMNLAVLPPQMLKNTEQKTLEQVLDQYINAMEYAADFTFSGLNLGNLYYYLNQPEKSEAHYRQALRIAHEFNPVKLNLAVLLSGQGKAEEAEQLLREVISSEPDSWETHYRLGLLLAERKKMPDAILHLEKAAEGYGTRARIYYNLGLLYEQLQKHNKAETALLKAISLEPTNADFLYGMSVFYYKTGNLLQAERTAQNLLERYPQHQSGQKIINLIKQKRQ